MLKCLFISCRSPVIGVGSYCAFHKDKKGKEKYIEGIYKKPIMCVHGKVALNCINKFCRRYARQK